MTLPSDPVFYIVASLAVLIVGVAKGGFAGMGAAAMPLLALVMDPVRAAAMLLPILLVQDVVGVWAFRKSYDLPTLKMMVPGAGVGVFLGWLLASAVPADGVRGAVGLIALLFGAYRLIEARAAAAPSGRRLPDWLGAFWGGVAGFTSHIAHAGGPPFQVWALGRNFPQSVFIGTSAIFFAIINWMKVPAYVALGQFDRDNMLLTLLFLPLAIASTWTGVLLVKRLSPARFHTAINILMIAVGTELMRQSFA